VVRPWPTVDMGELMLCDTEIKRLDWSDKKQLGILFTHHGTYTVTGIPDGEGNNSGGINRWT